MTVITSPDEFNVGNLFIDLDPIGIPLYLKCEGFNFAGSVKLKTAISLVTEAENAHALRPGDTIVESSSGNLGIALSLLAASRGYRFVCVTDSRCTLGASQTMRAFGAQVQVITEPDPGTGLLGARIRRVQQLCRDHPGYVWLNQYSNPANWQAHLNTTGPEILREFPDVAVVFLGAGTTGTLMGCARHLRRHRPDVRIVAVDSVGSVTFGSPAGPRQLPGLGSGVIPLLLDRSLVDDVVHVSEPETVRSCRQLVRAGYLLGASTGTVVTGATKWLGSRPEFRHRPAVAVAPDLGDRYLDTVFEDSWVHDLYGPSALEVSPSIPTNQPV